MQNETFFIFKKIDSEYISSEVASTRVYLTSLQTFHFLKNEASYIKILSYIFHLLSHVGPC